ncbi:BLUF domain-containing protein [Jiella sonneratiae]|uniref:BLUF domain-containing protein n=1 Tax=Jiella sonneratiae TaxID=2816856 RepID=A0ABS3J0I3_9HYPH|nr:BLUF domain-containing protein [Jiella sonneratiae]MBO0903199.1 BLUF domain-containing protein [Jiella sonneratiae]
MRHISYTSLANGLTGEDFAGIVDHAREWNRRHEVRGAIAFDGRMITQILQGPPETVDRLFMRIRADQRHGGVVLQSRADIPDSQFEGFGLSRMTPSDLFMIAVEIEERHGAGDRAADPLVERFG